MTKELDVRGEEYRIYTYPNGGFRIDDPVAVYILDSGSHRVVDAAGLTHRPSPGWIALSWKPRDGQPAFIA